MSKAAIVASIADALAARKVGVENTAAEEEEDEEGGPYDPLSDLPDAQDPLVALADALHSARIALSQEAGQLAEAFAEERMDRGEDGRLVPDLVIARFLEVIAAPLEELFPYYEALARQLLFWFDSLYPGATPENTWEEVKSVRLQLQTVENLRRQIAEMETPEGGTSCA